MALQLSVSQPNILKQGSEGYAYFYNLLTLRRMDNVELKGHRFKLKIHPDRAIEVTSVGIEEPKQPAPNAQPAPLAASKELVRPANFAQLLG